MAYLPGLTHDEIESWGWTQAQIISYLSVIYPVIIVYGILTVVALRNIIVIVVKQKEYKNLPILMFYLFALVAVTLREVKTIWHGLQSTFIDVNLDFVQQFSKFSVGLVQDWITLELAVRIHCVYGSSDISETGKKKLHSARRIFFTIIGLVFAALCVASIVTGIVEKDRGTSFLDFYCLTYDILGYFFLT